MAIVYQDRYSVRAQGATAASSDRATVGRPVVTNSTAPAPRGIPGSIPADELFFWTEDWRQSEGRAEADIRAGRVREFSNAHQAIRYLLSDR